MQTIEYRVTFTGASAPNASAIARSDNNDSPTREIIRVHARNINAGYAKALKLARVPLGNGRVREIGSVEFWQVL